EGVFAIEYEQAHGQAFRFERWSFSGWRIWTRFKGASLGKSSSVLGKSGGYRHSQRPSVPLR
ncbi:hypothetical protein M2C68_22030, partial [Pseudomonas sp. BAgro211]|nr:hypothetical protein [Pseudomonas sp. BAgro211]